MRLLAGHTDDVLRGAIGVDVAFEPGIAHELSLEDDFKWPVPGVSAPKERAGCALIVSRADFAFVANQICVHIPFIDQIGR